MKDGDKFIITVKEPGKPEYNVEYNIKVKDNDTEINDQLPIGGVTIEGSNGEFGNITSQTYDATTGYVTIKYDSGKTIEQTGNYTFKLSGLDISSREATTISAAVDYASGQPDATTGDKKISLEAIKTPEIIFDEAEGSKTVSRETADLDGDRYNADVTIKIPSNVVTGDILSVEIIEPKFACKTGSSSGR